MFGLGVDIYFLLFCGIYVNPFNKLYHLREVFLKEVKEVL